MAAEVYATDLMEDSYFCMMHGKRTTLMVSDMRLVIKLRGENIWLAKIVVFATLIQIKYIYMVFLTFQENVGWAGKRGSVILLIRFRIIVFVMLFLQP